jgi:hypothetical protein
LVGAGVKGDVGKGAVELPEFVQDLALALIGGASDGVGLVEDDPDPAFGTDQAGYINAFHYLFSSVGSTWPHSPHWLVCSSVHMPHFKQGQKQ